MLFKSKDETDEVVLLAELLDVLEVGTLGAAVDKLSDAGIVFAADGRGRVGVLAAVANELRNEKAARDSEQAERERVAAQERERQLAEQREQAERERAEREAEEAKVRAYQHRVRALEEVAGMNVVQLEINYRRHLRTQLGTGYSVQGQREQAERTIPLEELEAWVGAYTEKEVS